MTSVRVLCLVLGIGQLLLPRVADADAFAVFPLGAGSWETIVYAPSGDVDAGLEEIRFNRHQRSEFYPLIAGVPLQLYRRRDDFDGESRLEPLISCSLDTPRSLLLLDPVRGVFQVPYSEVDFPFGAVMFANTLPVPVAVGLGDEQLLLQPTDCGPVLVQADGRTSMAIRVDLRGAERRIRVLDNVLSVDPGRRTLVILLPPRQPGATRIRAIRLSEVRE